MDPNMIMELLLQLLTQPPEEPAGGTPHGLPASGIPASLMEGSPEEAQMGMMLQLLQGLQMQQSAQQSMNGAQGGMGAMFGGMGGRPPGS